MAAIWKIGSNEADHYPTLTHHIDADVAIIGAGITGLTTAERLAETGLSVVVIEALTVGKGGTGGSTGNLYSILASGLAPLRKKWGDDIVRKVVTSRSQAIDYIEEAVERFGIDCQFHRRPLYRIATNEDKKIVNMLDAEHEAMVLAGLNIETIEDSPLPFAMERGLKIEGQAQFNPLNYVHGLAKAISLRGVEIYENSPVRKVDYDQGIIETDSAHVTVKHIVHATHTPKGISLLHTMLLPSREYGVSAKINSDVYPNGIFFVHDSFHSIRSYQHENEQYVMVIGEQHKTGEGDLNNTCFDNLRDYMGNHFEMTEFCHQWSNQQYSPADSLPYIGKIHGQDHAYLATGFSGDGLVWGTLAGQIISDLILGEENPWHASFDARRFTPAKSAMKWAEENASVSKSLFKDYLGTKKLKEIEEIGRGQGKVVSAGGEKLAIYRDETGKLSALSAICPHMMCLVHWNGVEASWDCPCHGSRFDLEGEVSEGPSLHPLAKRDPPS
ncbi:FAD-dependent oxidoreductase [Vreelandella glaciei]|uniref:FAD-dependent oxidoreductase n=1 Tax=Vreelandella glaciei TaxID=186761 RepID=UPI0030029E99